MQRQQGFPFAFACKRSGNCCAIPGGFVRVIEEEQARIAAQLGLDLAAFRSRYLMADGATLKDGLGNRCVFLADGREAGCSIYATRPRKCREWPFWPELRTDERLRHLVLRTCPGIVPDQDP